MFYESDREAHTSLNMIKSAFFYAALMSKSVNMIGYFRMRRSCIGFKFYSHLYRIGTLAESNVNMQLARWNSHTVLLYKEKKSFTFLFFSLLDIVIRNIRKSDSM